MRATEYSLSCPLGVVYLYCFFKSSCYFLTPTSQWIPIMFETIVIRTPLGNLLLAANDHALIQCLWTDENITEKNNHPVLITATKQLQEYFNLQRKIFDLPLMPIGTVFQKRVWEALLAIPYGKTCSYHDIAKQITQEKASRAVGSANAKNPLCIFIPCHRVINASGKLGGYSGGITHKIELLKLENSIFHALNNK